MDKVRNMQLKNKLKPFTLNISAIWGCLIGLFLILSLLSIFVSDKLIFIWNIVFAPIVISNYFEEKKRDSLKINILFKITILSIIAAITSFIINVISNAINIQAVIELEKLPFLDLFFKDIPFLYILLFCVSCVLSSIDIIFSAVFKPKNVFYFEVAALLVISFVLYAIFRSIDLSVILSNNLIFKSSVCLIVTFLFEVFCFLTNKKILNRKINLD